MKPMPLRVRHRDVLRGLATAVVIASIVGACTLVGGPSAPVSQTLSPPGSALSSATSPTGTISPSQATVSVAEYKSSVSRATPSASAPGALKSIAAADTTFALALYQAQAESHGDVFLSPYSIATALSMVYAGARGNTASEMADVLGISDPETWHEARNYLDLTITLPRPLPAGLNGEATAFTLETTNGIFGQAGYPFEQPFLDTLATDYGAGMQAVDYQQPEAARSAINAWVAQHTNDRIKEILASGTIDALTRAVLVNTIYFKANWIYNFDPKTTAPADFHRLDGSTVSVPTMHLGGPKIDWAAGDGWVAANLPYFGGTSMLLIVPDPGRFATIESALDPGFLGKIDTSLGERELMLSLPKWSSEYSADLNESLKQMGIHDLFDPLSAADLSGITRADYLFISHVAHKANIDVDEEGTEAAAATAAVAQLLSGAPSATLTVDRPFIYLIRDDATGEILFMGRVLDPS